MTHVPGGRRIVLVAAYADNRVIGVDGDIPWRIPEDLAHFKAATLGHTLLMGRATYDSIGRPLPGRTTIVLTRDPAWSAGEHADRVLVAHSFEEALDLAALLPGDVMVAGGAQVYALALPHATHQVLTEVHRVVQGDTFYPELDDARWRETAREEHDGYAFVWLERRMIRVDQTLPEPPYDQVRTQIAAAVDAGELQPGDRLPTVRQLAADLELAPNTVARAYRELEAAGVIDTRGRAGTFVAGNQVDRAAREAAAAYARRTRELGLSRAEALALVERTLAR